MFFDNLEVFVFVFKKRKKENLWIMEFSFFNEFFFFEENILKLLLGSC